MSIFDWDESYVVDRAMIDEQHKHLLEVAETLFNAVIKGEDDVHLQKCFDALLDYTQKHFTDEEQFFKSQNAAQLDKHIEEHGVLAGELVQVWEEEKLGFKEEKGRYLLSWVEERLLPHMMIDDQETYAGCTV
jgi:hemerythrin